MGPGESDTWKNEALEELFKALATRSSLKGVLIFKGARILNARLNIVFRQSFDIDANLSESFLARFPERKDQEQFLAKELRQAIENHMWSMDPVVYRLLDVIIRRRPRGNHPRGWNAFEVRVSLEDLRRPGAHHLPALSFDLAAPEALSGDSVRSLAVGNWEVEAYTAERQIGEKMRAFLSRLPRHRQKLGDGQIGTIRVKDIYDIGAAAKVVPLSEREFWFRVGREFQLACESRGVDCRGLEDFEEDLMSTKAAFEGAEILPKDIEFKEAWETIRQIVQFISDMGIIPFDSPLPGA